MIGRWPNYWLTNGALAEANLGDWNVLGEDDIWPMSPTSDWVSRRDQTAVLDAPGDPWVLYEIGRGDGSRNQPSAGRGAAASVASMVSTPSLGAEYPVIAG